MTLQATLFLIVGLPGAGKTTRARELEKAHRALRFCPDEWMIPLFGESDADGKRDLLEGLLINAGLCARLRIGDRLPIGDRPPIPVRNPHMRLPFMLSWAAARRAVSA